MTAGTARARLEAPGWQIVHVTVRDGYRPRTIEAQAGVPLRVVFHRDEATPCSERVVFSSPHLDRHLAPHGETIVELPAQGPGEVRFTCAMGRYRGRIRLADVSVARDRGPWNPWRLRRLAVATTAVATTGVPARRDCHSGGSPIMTSVHATRRAPHPGSTPGGGALDHPTPGPGGSGPGVDGAPGDRPVAPSALARLVRVDRRIWLAVGALVTIAGLLAAGVPASTVLLLGALGGCAGMHLFMGHGGHGGHAGPDTSHRHPEDGAHRDAPAPPGD